MLLDSNEPQLIKLGANVNLTGNNSRSRSPNQQDWSNRYQNDKVKTYAGADTHDRMAYELRKKRPTLNPKPTKSSIKKGPGWTDN